MHRLENRKAEAFGERGKQEGLAVLVEPLAVGVVHLAGQDHAAFEPAARDLAAKKFAVGRGLLAGDHEPPIGHPLGQVEEHVEIFVGQAVAHGEQDSAGWQPGGPGRGRGRRRREAQRHHVERPTPEFQPGGDVVGDEL